MPPFFLRRQFFVFAPPTAKLMRTKKRLSHRCRRWLRGGDVSYSQAHQPCRFRRGVHRCRHWRCGGLRARRIRRGHRSRRLRTSASDVIYMIMYMTQNRHPPTTLRAANGPLQHSKDAARPSITLQRRGTTLYSATKAAKGRQRPPRGDLRSTPVLKAAKGRQRPPKAAKGRQRPPRGDLRSTPLIKAARERQRAPESATPQRPPSR